MKSNAILEKGAERVRRRLEEADDDAAGSMFRQRAAALKNTAQQWQRQAADATSRAAKATDLYVKDNPWAILGCVAACCFTLGFLFGQNSD